MRKTKNPDLEKCQTLTAIAANLVTVVGGIIAVGLYALQQHADHQKYIDRVTSGAYTSDTSCLTCPLPQKPILLLEIDVKDKMIEGSLELTGLEEVRNDLKISGKENKLKQATKMAMQLHLSHMLVSGKRNGTQLDLNIYQYAEGVERLYATAKVYPKNGLLFWETTMEQIDFLPNETVMLRTRPLREMNKSDFDQNIK